MGAALPSILEERVDDLEALAAAPGPRYTNGKTAGREAVGEKREAQEHIGAGNATDEEEEMAEVVEVVELEPFDIPLNNHVGVELVNDNEATGGVP